MGGGGRERRKTRVLASQLRMRNKEEVLVDLIFFLCLAQEVVRSPRTGLLKGLIHLISYSSSLLLLLVVVEDFPMFTWERILYGD